MEVKLLGKLIRNNTVLKTWRILFVVGLMLAVSLFAGCASTPEEGEPNATTPVEEGEPEATIPVEDNEMDSAAPLEEGESGCDMVVKDSESAEVMHFSDVRNARYAEVFLICGDAGTGIYNTADLNNEEDPRDTSPDSIMANFSTETVKEQYGVQDVNLNGPRYFLMDSFDIPTAPTVRDFDGLKARWMANLHPGATAGGQPYVTLTVDRESTWFFDKGKPVFILDDPNGTVWVMKSYTDVVDEDLTYEDLDTLDTRLELPEGWSYRVEVLDENLTMAPVNGTARITQDELQNTYDACDEGACNLQL